MFLLFLLPSLAFINQTSLISNIFENYNKDAMPSDMLVPLNLSLGMALRAFKNIDQMEGTITANIWLRYKWHDERLEWDINHYNHSFISLNTNPDLDNSIWVPDIYLYNTAEKPLDELDYSKAIIKYNGEVIWSRPGMLTSTCQFDLTHFPYDRQFCELKFGSWSYDGNQLNLLIYDAGFDISNYNEHEEWILSDYYVEKNIEYYNCCTEPYHDLRFHYVLIRKSEYYELNIILPTFATSSLILFTLIVPWSSGERISFATTVMLSIIVFLLILSDNLPKSDQKPLLSRMIIGLTLFSLLGVFFTIFISALSDYNDNLGEKNYEFSNKFIVFLHDKLQKLKLCKRKKKRQITQQNNNTNTPELSQITDGLTIRTTTYHEAISNQNHNNDENQNQNENSNDHSNEHSNEDNQNQNQNSNDANQNNNKKNEIVKEDCKRMIAYFEHVYIVVFFVAFVLYCIIMFAIIPRY